MQLFTALSGANRKVNGKWISGSEININGVNCLLASVQREDGSGSSFNLLLYGPDGKMYKSYVRTID